MSTPISSLRRARRWLIAFAFGPAVLIGVLVALPKNPAYAAVDRFVMTAVALGAALTGCIGFTVAWRRYREAAIRARWSKATRAIRDTLQYLLQEQRASRRYRLPLLGGFVLASGLVILSRWPQLSVLESFRAIFGTCAVGCLVLLLIQPLHARRSIVNSLFLRRYLRQQAEYVGFIPRTYHETDSTHELPVVVTGPLRFRAGGFEWMFDDLQKNALVQGQPGSGKTIAVLNSLLEGLLACGSNEDKTAGVIFDPKGTWRDTIGPLCQRLGRGDDLYILSLANWATAGRTAESVAFNPVHTEDEAGEVAARFFTVAKLVGGVRANDSFFLEGSRVFVRHGYTLLRDAAAPTPTNLLDLHRLCAEPVEEPEIYKALIETLRQKYADDPPADIETAVHYFETEWRNLPDRQRAGVRSVVIQILDDFTSQPISEIISGESTISIPNILDDGKIFYVHLPLAERERLSRILTGLIKLEVQREVLRRPGKSRRSFLIADEFQSLFVTGEDHGDSDFFERSRESNHANLVAGQNISSFLKKTGNRAEVTNFLGLCAVKIFLRNSERESNEWASQLFGERSEILVTASEAARLDGGWSRNQTSYSRSTRAVRVVPPEAFTTLAVPAEGDPKHQFTESIVHLGSRAVTAKLDLTWRVHPLRP